ncbi:hypothetical protein HY029_06095 [Candidatus Gottesmanbacteria bacterium]|nr:hypothetical protein [Candidatus Gottesmanbacteria bacterium]
MKSFPKISTVGIFLILLISTILLISGFAIGYKTSRTDIFSRAESGLAPTPPASQYGSISGTITIDKNVYDSLDKSRSLVVSSCDVVPKPTIDPQDQFQKENTVDIKDKYLDCPRNNWFLVSLVKPAKFEYNKYIFRYNLDKVPIGTRGITLLSYYFTSRDEIVGILFPDKTTIESQNCELFETDYKQDCTLSIDQGSEVKLDYKISKSASNEVNNELYLYSLIGKDNKVALNKWLEKADKETYNQALSLITSSVINVKIEKNEDYKPVYFIIKEAVYDYLLSNPGKNVIYKSTRKDENYYNAIATSGMYNILQRSWMPETVAGHIFVAELLPTYFKNFGSMENYILKYSAHIYPTYYPGYILQGSGLYTYLKDKIMQRFGIDDKRFADITLSIIYNRYNQKAEDVEIIDVIEDEAKNWVEDSKSFIVEEYDKSNEPISTSTILRYYLEKNNGNLSESLWDVAILYKILVRFDHFDNTPLFIVKPDTIETKFSVEKASKVAGFTAKYIKDEFTKVNNFNSLKQNLDTNASGNESEIYYDPNNPEISLVNQVGNAYRKMNTISLLVSYPPNFLKFLMVVESQYKGDVHGIVKKEVDYDAALSLDEVDSYLQSFLNSP